MDIKRSVGVRPWSVTRLYVMIMLVAFLSEVLAHLGLLELPGWKMALADSGLLIAIMAPLLWLLVVRPLRHQAATEQAKSVAIIDTAAEGIVTISDKGLIQSFNPAAVKMFGYSPDEVLGYRVNMLMPLPEREEHDQYIANFLSTGQMKIDGIGRDVFGQRKDGTRFPMHLTISKVRVGDQRFFAGVIRDITEQKRAEEALRLSEHQYRLLFESNPHPMWLFDRSTLSFLAVNDAAIRHYGYSREEFLAMTILDIRTAEEIPALLALLDKISKGHEDPVYFGVCKHRKQDGTIIDVEITTHKLIFEGRQAELVLASDITGRKRAEESAQKLLGAVEQTDEVIFMTDTEGAINYINPAFEKVYGFTKEEAIGKNPRILQSGRYDKEYYHEFWRVLLSDKPILGTIMNKTKQGKIVTMECSVNSVFDAEGRRIGFIAVQEDVTERKQLEAQFLQAQKMEAVGQLAGGVAHDFNNILMAITSYCEILFMKMRPSDPSHMDVVEIQKAAQKASGLVRQLLAFSRKQVLELKVLDLEGIIKNTDGMLRRIVPENIELSILSGNERGRVKADPGQVEQVILNLAVNARDAMPEGGRLVIETANVDLSEEFSQDHSGAVPGRYVMVSVSDTGCGMNEETKSRIFEPFFTTKELGKGTGLGLSTVYGIVKQSGGYLTVDSRLGVGTTFKIYFPRVDDPIETTRSSASSVAAGLVPGSGTILLVDDNDAVREAIGVILGMCGYHVLKADHGEQALEISEKHNGGIDLLITDLVMPKMGGVKLTELLTRLHPQMKVIYMSGYPEDGAFRGQLSENRSVYLQKPVPVEALTQKVRQLLNTASIDES
jgi:PAS domain S-box-containing protein